MCQTLSQWLLLATRTRKKITKENNRMMLVHIPFLVTTRTSVADKKKLIKVVSLSRIKQILLNKFGCCFKVMQAPNQVYCQDSWRLVWMNLEILIIGVAQQNKYLGWINQAKSLKLESSVLTNSRTFMFSDYLLFLGWNDWISTYIFTSPE